MAAAAGLLLLTGGRGRRFGAPKHLQPHPHGGSWGGHLVDVFGAVFPGGPVQLLGEGLPERPELPVLDDPRQGPAAALRAWAGAGPAPARRWWVAACDQIHWTPAALAAWHAAVEQADPAAEHWVLARIEGRLQPLGGFLAGGLVPRLAEIPGAALLGLVDALPVQVLEREAEPWRDVDTLDDLRL